MTEDTSDVFNKKFLRVINGTRVYTQVNNIFPKELKNLADKIKKEIKSGIIILISVSNEKISIVVSVSNDLVAKFKANILIKELSIFFGGTGGGGREDLAQGGGSNTSKVQDVDLFIESLFD